MSGPEPGKPFGAYLVEASVGQGGMGAVYRARDSKLGRTVALKVMLPSEAADPESRARFVREARLAAALEHPGIVRVYEVGEIDGAAYIAMEWVDGRTLRASKVDDPNKLLERIAETLAFAHSRGVIHRDLKPANVMIDAYGDPKLVDFGIAKRLAPSATFATQDGTVLGTPQYMAPEQMLSSAVDARADQYAWGVIAYELLTGERPLRPALAHAALDEHHGPIVMRALSDAPSDRFASMRELLDAWTRKPAPIRAPAPAPAPRGRPWILGVVAAFAVVVVGAGAAIYLTRPKPVVARSSPSPLASSSAPVSEAPIPTATSSEAPADPPESSSEPPAASATKAAPRATRIANLALSGQHIYYEDIDRARTTLSAAYRKCIAGMPLRGNKAEIRIEYHVMHPPITGSVTIDGMGERGWPPPATVACLQRETLALKLLPTPDATVGTILMYLYPR